MNVLLSRYWSILFTRPPVIVCKPVSTKVKSFQEKPQLNEGWINGGFFVVEPRFLEMIENDQTILERSPLEQAAMMGELVAYQHHGFWQCMDTKRDKDNLNEIFKDKKIKF